MIKCQDGVYILEFGTGDIAINNAYQCNDETELLNEVNFCQGETGEIGRNLEDNIGKTSDDLGVAVRMIFNKAESVQVVIDALEHCKRCLNDRDDQIIDERKVGI